MKISIVTVCYNSAKTIKDTINSVLNQNYTNYEHIIVDGVSTDDTLKIIKSFNCKNIVIYSEPDNGIYDAMNKGFNISSGEIIGYLNSDDAYLDGSVISEVMNLFRNPHISFVYGDIYIVNNYGKIIRSWRPGLLGSLGLNGRQLPHPAFFVRKSVLDKLEIPFDVSFKIAADLKQQLLIINKLGLRGAYINRSLVKMRLGGASTRNIFSFYNGWIESIKAYNEIFGHGGTYFTLKKVISKIRHIRF